MKKTMPVEGKFELMALPYAADALEPVISADTLGFHHGKHLQAYVDNLNKLIAGTEYESMSLEQIVISSAAEKSTRHTTGPGRTGPAGRPRSRC